MPPLVLAITGASGAIYATRLLDVLVRGGEEVHLTISPSGKIVLKQELDIDVSLDRFQPDSLLHDPEFADRVHYHHFQDFMAPIASGSFLTRGMVICPCSGSTLGGIAHAIGDNLVHRAAEVHLKERRRLIVVPRETPLSLPQIENMKLVAQAGAVVLPAMPGWYHGVTSLKDLVDFVVARILDQLGMKHELMRRWGESEGSETET